MHPWSLWPEDPIFIEFGVRDADLALSLREDDYTRYLGVSDDAARIERLQAEHPQSPTGSPPRIAASSC